MENNINEVNYFKRNEILEQEEAKNFKKSMRDRRQQYGELVRELFGPRVDVKSNFLQKTDRGKSDPPKSPKEKDLKLFIGSISTLRPKRKPSKKIQEPQTPDAKSMKKFNYLTELRNRRYLFEDDTSLDDALSQLPGDSVCGSKSEVLKKIQNLEKIANKEEHKIKLLDPITPKGLEMEEKINELLMQSIRAKANMLE